VTVCWR